MHTKAKISVLCGVLLFSLTIGRAGEIHDAVKSGELEKVKGLLNKDPGVVNAKDDRSCTPLHFAAEGGHQEIARLLLVKGAEINAREINSNTPLHYAAQNGKVGVAELLLNNGADINAQNKDKFASLHLAAWHKQKSVIRLLVEKGAEIDIREYRGATPLMMSIWRMDDIEIVRFLVNKGADVNAKVEGSWVTPIALAAQYGYADIVNYLLNKGAFVDHRSRVLVRFSVARGLERLFKILEKKGANLNVATNNGGTILHFAAEGGSAEIIKILIKKGFNHNQVDRYGWTPLHYAAQYGQKAAVEFLVSKGADMNKRILTGKTAFNMATERGYPEVAQLLASKGADQAPQQFPILEGKYLGQKPPGDTPEIFALGIVSTPYAEHGGVSLSPDGNTVYWTSEYKRSGSEGSFKVFSSHVANKRWTAPEYAFFTGDLLVDDDVPTAAPDGKRILFMSKRPMKSDESSQRDNYWVIDRTETGWSEPTPISETVGRMTIRWQISVSNKGTLYFGSTDAGGKGSSDIYKSELRNGEYAKPENLGDTINTENSENAPFIAPDESYLIFGRAGQGGRARWHSLHISFRDKDGNWMKPINLAEVVDTDGGICPSVSPDGKYLFFNSGASGNYDIYWVDAKVIEKLRPGGTKK